MSDNSSKHRSFELIAFLKEYEVYLYENQIIQKNRETGKQYTYYKRGLLPDIFDKNGSHFMPYKVKADWIEKVIYIKKNNYERQNYVVYFYVLFKDENANLYELNN